MKLLTHDELKRILDYNPETGIFIWKVKISKKTVVGTQAGGICKRSGYRRLRIYGHHYRAARLAFFYAHGRWPVEIDHKEHVRFDDRIDFIREATREQNTRNVRKHADNKSGFKGVSQKRGRWRATIRVNGKQCFLGTFASPQAAHDAYIAAAKLHHGDFTCVC